ncbi:hypothetical protein [Rossellomorea marisflavi]|uniref:hypothetical protein n=1 Tax=Rossellomorea marisflavi TaxID=189381 RepID=UPI003F9F4A5D
MEQTYEEYFKSMGTGVVSSDAQAMMLNSPKNWNRYVERAILNSIEDGELPSGEARFFKDYFEGAHERISYKSLQEVVNKMEGNRVKIVTKSDDILITSDEMDKQTLLGWLADLFPKYG